MRKFLCYSLALMARRLAFVCWPAIFFASLPLQAGATGSPGGRIGSLLPAIHREAPTARGLKHAIITYAPSDTSIRVSGSVKNGAGEVLTGVSVQIKGSHQGTVTDASGKFSLEAPARAALVFSYIGYQQKTVALNGQHSLNITLELGTASLDQVIVTGYSSERKKDLTGAVTVVNVKDMTKQPSGLVTNLLQGQTAGLTVIESGQPGEDPQIRIRGINTFGNNIPLYVVDGIPTQDIANLNPNDIASIQVLKDAGAASIYGSRASNGVIIITTKKGKGKLKVEYDAYYGTQVPRSGNVWHLLNPQDAANYEWESLKNNGITPSDPLFGSGTTPVLPDYIAPRGAHEGDPAVDPSKYYVNPDYTNVDDYNSFYRITKANKTGTDWFHEIFKKAPTTSHNISVSGSGDNSSYLISFNYYNQQGTLLNTYLKRYTIRSNTEFQVAKHIRVGENLAYSISHNPNRINVVNQFAGASPIFYALQIPPIIPVYDIKGNYGGTYGTPNYTSPNPVAVLQRASSDEQTTNKLFGSAYVNIDFLRYFSFNTRFGGENLSSTSSSFRFPTYENAQNQTVNQFYQNSDATVDWTWTNTLTFSRIWNKVHNLRIFIGTEAYQEKYSNMSASTLNYFSFDPNYVTLSSGSGTKTNSGGRSMESLSSEFGRFDYSYRDKYLLSGTIRRDGSSKFVDEKYGWFPSISAGWRLTQENFMKRVSWIEDLKIRGSWGVMGNQLNVNADNGYYTYVSNNIATYYDIGNTNNTIVPGFHVGQIGNPAAKWEKDINANIGIDATLLGGKISLTADYYTKNISDLLYNPALLGTQGAGTAPFVNIAKVKNTGIDLSLSGNAVILGSVQLNATLSFTSYKNEIKQVTDNTNYFWTNDERQFGDYFIRNEVGHSIGSFYGYKITGFWNSTDEIAAADETARKSTNNPAATYQDGERIGFFRYADVNGDGQITADDRTFIGNPNPKFSGGLNLSLTYRNFDLFFFLYGVQGNQIWNDVLAFTDLSGTSYTSLYDHWTPDNHHAKAPLPGTYASYQGTPNSYFIENGSYLKLKNIQLGYTLPSGTLKAVGVQMLKIYVQAANLFTITPYTGLDPEISGSVTDFGVDEAIYPTEKQFLLGISLSF